MISPLLLNPVIGLLVIPVTSTVFRVYLKDARREDGRDKLVTKGGLKTQTFNMVQF